MRRGANLVALSRRSIQDPENTVPRIIEPVEKVGIEPIATTNRAPKTPKPAYLAPDLGQWQA
jgi:hypothetical protein